MHQDFGVGIALEVIIALVEQFLAKFLVVGELAVEGEGEPLGLAAVIALEGLGVALVVGPAGRIADVADRGGAVLPAHDLLEFLFLIEPEPLGDRPNSLWVVRIALRSAL